MSRNLPGPHVTLKLTVAAPSPSPLPHIPHWILKFTPLPQFGLACQLLYARRSWPGATKTRWWASKDRHARSCIHDRRTSTGSTGVSGTMVDAAGAFMEGMTLTWKVNSTP